MGLRSSLGKLEGSTEPILSHLKVVQTKKYHLSFSAKLWYNLKTKNTQFFKCF